MFTAQFTQKYYLSWRSLQHCQGPLIHHITRHARRISGPILPTSVNNASAMPNGVIRRYQVVVAATQDMGIGKDGKLPWTLPSDLRYFKEVTTTTSVAGMRNAVIMGRRTWESIPLKYQPLPGRLNVVLSRSGKMGLATLDDLVICTDLNSALKFLAEPPLSLSVEKVFIIGGGQVLKETLNAPGCEAIHLTDIKSKVECDTFIPRIDSSSFVPLLSSREMVENNIRYSFLTYVRMNNSAEESKASGTEAAKSIQSNTAVKKAKNNKEAADVGQKKPETEAAAKDDVPVSLLNIQVGLIRKAWKHPSADSLLVEEIDVGESKVRQVVSGLAKYCSPDDLANRRVALITNVKPGKLRDVVSEGLVLCASSEDHSVVEPLLPPEAAQVGERVSFSGHEGKAEDVLNPKKKQLEKITPHLFTDENGVATYKGIPFMTCGGPCTSSIRKGSIK